MKKKKQEKKKFKCFELTDKKCTDITMLLHRNDWLIVSQKHYPTTKHVIIVHLARSNVSSSSIHRQWREFRLVLRLWNIRKEHSRSFAMLTSPRAFLTMWHRKMTSIRITEIRARVRIHVLKEKVIKKGMRGVIICRVLWASIKLNPASDRVRGMYLRTKK